MIVKTQDLTGAALDWVIAQAEELEEIPGNPYFYYFNDTSRGQDAAESGTFNPSTSWALGGPIMEREGISTVKDDGDNYWQAVTKACSGSMLGSGLNGEHWQQGPTSLIAGMRCYAASKLGLSIDVPDDLVEKSNMNRQPKVSI